MPMFLFSVHILDRFESMRIEPLNKSIQENAEENEEEEETTENGREMMS